jgi:hypothetical protein
LLPLPGMSALRRAADVPPVAPRADPSLRVAVCAAGKEPGIAEVVAERFHRDRSRRAGQRARKNRCSARERRSLRCPRRLGGCRPGPPPHQRRKRSIACTGPGVNSTRQVGLKYLAGMGAGIWGHHADCPGKARFLGPTNKRTSTREPKRPRRNEHPKARRKRRL